MIYAAIKRWNKKSNEQEQTGPEVLLYHTLNMEVALTLHSRALNVKRFKLSDSLMEYFTA